VHAASWADAGAGRDGVDFQAHARKVLLTLPLVLAGMLVRPGWLRRRSHWVYGACLVLLVLLFFVGQERNNAQRWIQLPKFDLQPSELAKLGVILMLARLLARNRLTEARHWVAPGLTVLVPMVMVIIQPDLGTALTLVPIALGMFYLAGARATSLASIIVVGLFLGFLAFQGGAGRAYQVKRVETWLDSFEPEDLIQQRNRAGFHAYHSRAVIGNGGWLGRGLGEGVANTAGHLPERDSDSLFAVIAEETGFLGTVAILALYVLMIVLLMTSAASLRDRYARLVVGGVALYFAAHLFVNAGVNLGLLPMTGLTLPLFSTGGSSLLVTFLSLGIAVGLASQHQMQLDQDAFRTY
jgi:rod shape determining protein RodA